MEDLLIYKTGIDISAGKLLISEPQLLEESFYKSVIYMCHHDKEESVGYVLNKKAAHNVGYYIPELAEHDFPLFEGGPVGLDTLHIIHRAPKLLGGEQTSDTIFWGGDLEAAIENILIGKITEHNCRFFIGYSGWGEGQLTSELDMQSWLVANTNPALVFETSYQTQWKDAIASLGQRFNPLLHVPKNPAMN